MYLTTHFADRYLSTTTIHICLSRFTNANLHHIKQRKVCRSSVVLHTIIGHVESDFNTGLKTTVPLFYISHAVCPCFSVNYSISNFLHF